MKIQTVAMTGVLSLAGLGPDRGWRSRQFDTTTKAASRSQPARRTWCCRGRATA